MRLKWLDDLAQDLRFAVRGLIRHPGYTAAALATLAVGIGATTAIFGVVNALVLRPLPFAEPERLVQLYGTSALVPERDVVANFETFRRESASFEALVAYEVGARYLREGAEVERVMTVRTQHDFFSMLGVPPAIGRAFRADDAPAVAVASAGFVKARFGDAAPVVGRTILLDDQAIAIVGVMPEGFQFPYKAASLLPGVAAQTRTDLWMLFDQPLQPRARAGNVTGRLRAGVAIAAAGQELSAIARRLEAQYPETNAGRGVHLEPLSEAVVSPPVRRVLFLVFGAVALVLALACANVVNLSLAHTAARTREVAVRSAIGADRGRLVRQFLAESVLLSLAGGAAGLALAWWGTGQVVAIAAPHIPRAQEVGVDWRVFLFLLLASAVVGAVTGAAPAAASARSRSASVWALKDASARSTMSRGQRRLRDGLIVAEVAVALVLAVGAAVLVRELMRLWNTNSGMTTAGVVTFHLGHRTVSRAGERQFYAIAGRVSQLPGVRAAGFIQLLPLQNWGWTSNSSDFQIRGRPPLMPPFPIQLRYVTPGYFEALGIRITRGRSLTEADDTDAPPVILINEALVARAFSRDDPVGAATTRGTIAGVVADVRQTNLDQPAAPEIYYPIAQNWSQVSELGMTLVVSTRGDPAALVEPVRAAVRDVNPSLAIFNVKTMDRVVAESLSDFTLYLSLIAAFAAVAVLLAATGAYGVISYIASSRTREFAIRTALGATRMRVTRLVFVDGLRLTGVGLALGLAGAMAAAPALRALPVSVGPPDLMTTVPVAIVLGVVALAACLVPASRAAAVDPMTVLRND